MPIDLVTNILIVEDHDFQRRTMVRMLNSLGFSNVLESTNGYEALEIIRTAPRTPEIVLSDLNMPEMDGMAFIRQLVEMKSELGVIIISELNSGLIRSVAKMTDAYGARLLGVIEKPVSREQLVRALAAHRTASKAKQQPAMTSPFSLHDIRAGIANREFEPFFQPKIDVASGRVVGAEVLARWHHPTHGIVAPWAFIPELERHKDLDALTFLMLEKAAHVCRDWIATGFDHTVSVNLSLTSLADTSLANRITACVKDTGLKPKSMILEITETAAMTELAPALENLTRLCMHGFELSIDDYGTGFASMQQLNRVPFTELKIDGGFINGFTQNQAARVIVETSIALARGLRLKAVAEGVETEEDWNALKAANCDIAQGYFLAKPMQEEAFLEFCRQRKILI